ncbi:hypothetical protein [Microbacterium deminutum]|uniref:hypothetical protein n=1 Tax=Microbacterium deminutum TaxID=344164 RepID=UPI003CD0A68B
MTTTVAGSPATIAADQVAAVTVTNTYASSSDAGPLAGTGASVAFGIPLTVGLILLGVGGAFVSLKHRRRGTH